jgi:2-iminobutanoate/2-iminopropanoate deaminase
MKEIVQTDRAPKAVGPYSQAVRAGNFVFTAGQIPLDPVSGKLVEGSIREQTIRAMENLRAVLTASGTDFSKVVKTTVFLDDLSNFAQFNEVYAGYFPKDPPARSTFQVGGLPLGAKVEIEMVALVE